MSLQAISWVLDHSEAGGTARLLMIVLAHHTDTDGYVALSKATLADETRMSETTIWRLLHDLEVLGEIEAADIRRAPEWWKALPPNRRPRLYLMAAFLGSQYGTPARRRSGVALGSRRGRAGVHPQPSDQHIRDVSTELRTCIDAASLKPETLGPKTLPPWVRLNMARDVWEAAGSPTPIEETA